RCRRRSRSVAAWLIGTAVALSIPYNCQTQGSIPMANEQSPLAGDSANPATALVLQGVYLKDCSFEAPQGPRANGEWNPQISLDLNTNVQPLGNDLREVVLTVTVSAKQGENTLFLVEVKQAGAFTMQNLSGEEFKRAVGSICPGVLFPYARAVVSQLV